MRLIFGLLIASVFFVACGPTNTPQTKVLAKFDGGQIDQEFMDLALQGMPEKKQENLRKPEVFQEYFNRTLKARLYGLEAEKALKNKYSQLENFTLGKNVAQWYQEYHMVENHGYTTTELLMHFEKNQEKFKSADSTLKGMPLFDSMRSEIAKDLALNHPDFRTFFEKNKRRFQENPQANLAWIWSRKKGVLTKVKEELESGKLTWEEAFNQYSESKKYSNGDLGSVSPIDNRAELKPFLINLRTDLFAAQKWPVNSLQIITLGDQEAIFKVNAFKEGKLHNFEEVKDEVYRRFSGSFLRKKQSELIDSLKLKYKVVLLDEDVQNLTEKAIKQYQEFPQNYMTQPQWKIWVLEESKAPKNVLELQSLEEIQAAGFQDMSWILSTHSLPKAYGLVKGLNLVLKPDTKGVLSKSLLSAKGKIYVYVESYKEPKLKEFSRVQKSIETSIKAGKVEKIDPLKVLAKSKDNMNFITGYDWNQTVSELDPNTIGRITKTQLMDYLVSLKLFENEANNHGFTLRPEVKVKIKLKSDEFWSNLYQSDLLYDNIVADSAKLKSIFNQEKEVVNQRSIEEASKDLKLLSTLNEMDWKFLEESAWKGSISDPTNHKQLFYGNLNEFIQSEMDRQLFQIMVTRKLEVDSVFSANWSTIPDSIYNHAMSLYNSLKPKAKESVPSNLEKSVLQGQAIERFQFLARVAPDFAKMDSVYYHLAQLYQDRGALNQAIEAYQKILVFWPNSELAFRAAFLKGYLYYENLKIDDKATKAFEYMLEKYPKTELSDDAEVLLKDLKSGRTHLKMIMENLGK